MGAVADALAEEVRKRGYAASIRYEPDKSAVVCVIEAKAVTSRLSHGVDELEDTEFVPVGLEIWDFGVDPSGNVDVRWGDDEGVAQEYSSAPRSVDIKGLADRILGPKS